MRRRLLAVLLVATLAACSPAAPQVTVPDGASQQTADQISATLASLRQVDDLPLYEMTYHGDYDELTGIDGRPAQPFGCSLFFASGDLDRLLFARNFDWNANPALVLRTDPPDGYASISIVDVSYVGVASFEADRQKLLNAPLLPFDGLNEKGLAVGLAADESARLDPDPGKPTVGSVRIIRLILDHASTVDEALKIMDQYNLDFTGGPPLHYLLADASGASAVVEYVDGERVVVTGRRPWQALTNFRLAGSSEQMRQGDRRYSIASARLTAAGGVMDPAAALGVLREVSQAHTRWSVTYDLKSGAVHVVTGKRWETVHSFQLTNLSR